MKYVYGLLELYNQISKHNWMDVNEILIYLARTSGINIW